MRYARNAESVLQWERDWFRRASTGEVRRKRRKATTAGASRLYMNEQEFKTKLRDIATNAVRQSIKTPLERQRGAGHWPP